LDVASFLFSLVVIFRRCTGVNRTRKKYKINREQNRDPLAASAAAPAAATAVTSCGGGRKRQQANQNLDSLAPEPATANRLG
jgi:hypothetical protein